MMPPEEPSAEDLKHQQLEQERHEREELARADTGAEADRHRRRADKASYLREKLEERQRAEREADAEDAEGVGSERGGGDPSAAA